MRQGIKLAVFFIISVVLHGAGLWAAVGRIEPRVAEPSSEVAIIDRDLFFRQATRIETQTSRSVSASNRLAPAPATVMPPSEGGASVMPAPALAATEAEPERRDPVGAQSAVAQLDPATVEAAPPARRESVTLEAIEAERREPVRVAGTAATAPPAAIGSRLPRSADLAEAARVRAAAPASAPDSARLDRSAGAGAQLSASPAEPVARTTADAAARPPLDVVANVPATPPPALAIAPGVAESAPALAAAGSPRLEPTSPPAPAGKAVPSATPIEGAAPRRMPPEPERLLARDGRSALRGTLPPPLIAPREAAGAEPVDTALLAGSRGSGVRLRPTVAGEVARGRPSMPAVPRQSAPPIEHKVARAPRQAPSPAPPAPDSAPVAQAAPQQLAALAPAAAAAPSARVEISRGDNAEEFTRTYKGGECFFPLRVASRDGGAIQGYGVRAESVRMFREAFARALGTDPDVEWRPLTDAQCSGISFTRVILGDAAPSIRIGLARKVLASGEELAGRVTGNRYTFVTLLVVDDSGVVHNALDYLRFETAEVEFSVPVHPVDDGKDRVQLIMAVGASMRLPALESTAPVHSDDYFPELLRQAREAGAILELGLEDFVILSGPDIGATR